MEAYDAEAEYWDYATIHLLPNNNSQVTEGAPDEADLILPPEPAVDPMAGYRLQVTNDAIRSMPRLLPWTSLAFCLGSRQNGESMNP